MKKNNLITIITLLFVLFTVNSCKKYLDINSDPDTPQNPDPSSVFPAMLSAIPRGLQYDGSIHASKFVQNFCGLNTGSTLSVSNFDRMGYNAASDANGDIWRQCYFGLGKNLDYIISSGTQKKQWDYVGAAQVLKAMMFQYATDYSGEIIFKEAFIENKAFFKFDEQEVVYAGIDSILRLGIANLSRSDNDATTLRLTKGDFVFNGSNAKWVKFAWGLLARNAHRITNKANYNADSVIAFCNRSMVDINDDFLIPFDATKLEDMNFFGPSRAIATANPPSLRNVGQSDFIVKLLDGTTFTRVAALPINAANRDPRMKHLLTVSADTTNGNGGYRGVGPALGDPNYSLSGIYAVGTTSWINARKRIPLLYQDSSSSFALPVLTDKHYLFADKAVFPVMTSSEIQFMKAEAALRKNDAATALTAYTNGINLHFDFINRASFPKGNIVLYTGGPISPAQRAAYLASANVKNTPASLTLTDIMLQKYIALWGWGFFETFVDMRRYHWTDLDVAVPGNSDTSQVYRNFKLPAPLFVDNFNKPVYRVRPRFNSEYVWNRDELLRIGALNQDYHTYECWFSKP
ncbi:MAG: SusD/RagB family nutrient-binding outer membrane lipoprotein [Pedobacter sp.]|nr:SusD/RagB family nutrient-binding outer membrane lipoprotein [Pedobacter sp.]